MATVLKTDSLATSGARTASQTEQSRHNRNDCHGFGKILTLPSIARLLSVDLKNEGFSIRREVVGISDMLRYGSGGCEECAKLLRC